jgi:signal peptidase I
MNPADNRSANPQGHHYAQQTNPHAPVQQPYHQAPQQTYHAVPPQPPAPAPEPEPRSDTRGVTGRWLVETAALVLLAFVIAMGVRAFIVEPYRIPTGSMLPTIQIDDHILIYRLGTHLGSTPEQQDVIVFNDFATEFPNLVKRVVATEGQVIDFTPEGEVIVDGRMLYEPYLQTPSSTFPLMPDASLAVAIEYPFVVPEGHVFVLGDNRERSSDSRAFGPVPLAEVKGVAFFTYWPPGNFATLE